jgi:hypothetical protein
VLSWSRTNGNFTLAITSGINAKTGLPYGIPYGIIPRLLLVWMVTEIIRTKSRYLEPGSRFADFLLKLGLDPSNGTGKRSDTRRTREQVDRLINASVQFLKLTKDQGATRTESEKIPISNKSGLWWHDKDPEQSTLWTSYIIVSQEFFDEIMKAPNPLDVRVLRHIKDSSLGIDLYTILNREAYLAEKEDKTRFLAWEWIQERTGNEYQEGKNGLDKFRRKALEQIEAIRKAHPNLILTIVKGRKGRKSGIEISHLSRPSVLPREARPTPRIAEGQARPAPSLSVVPARIKHLQPAAVQTFRALYPGLDPYECQAAFDAWQERLPPEKKAQRYNSAFLGFAKSWATGKV